jgi:hypothetical protein
VPIFLGSGSGLNKTRIAARSPEGASGLIIRAEKVNIGGMKIESSPGSLRWWGKLIAVGGISLLLFCWGLGLLFNAYALTNPHEFIMIFFSASFMIMLGITGLFYPACRIYSYYKHETITDKPLP